MTTPGQGTSDPDQIRREIERTQANLSSDVDALTEKVTPGRIVERRVDAARGSVSRLKDRIMGGDSGPTGPGSQVGARAGDTARQVAGSVSGAASSAADSMSGAAATAAGAVQDAPQALRRQTQGSPLAAGLIAFGAGLLVSSLLPSTRREQELAQQARERAGEIGQPVVEAAKQAATEVRDNLSGPAQEAVQSVRSTAVDAGQTVADQGRSSAEEVRDRATDAQSNVRQNASN